MYTFTLGDDKIYGKKKSRVKGHKVKGRFLDWVASGEL